MKNCCRLVIAYVVAGLLVGCSTLPKPTEVKNYGDLPGTPLEAGSEPGLLSNHYSEKNGGGYLIYSSDSNSNALVNRADGASRSVSKQANSNKKNENAITLSTENGQLQETSYRGPAVSGGQSRPVDEYEEFKRFDKKSNDPISRREFEEFKKWRTFQEWERRRR